MWASGILAAPEGSEASIFFHTKLRKLSTIDSCIYYSIGYHFIITLELGRALGHFIFSLNGLTRILFTNIFQRLETPQVESISHEPNPPSLRYSHPRNRQPSILRNLVRIRDSVQV